MSTIPQERQEALDAANSGYQEFIDYIDEIREEDMLRPNTVGIWSGKDLLSHIADWELIGSTMVADIDAGKPEVWMPEEWGDDIDGYNQFLVSKNQDKNLDEIKAYLAESHAELILTFTNSTSERYDLLSGLTVQHYQLHYPDFRNCKPFKALSDEERAELIVEMETAHQDFLALIDTIPDEALLAENTIGVWSGKDLITHLGHWQLAAVDMTANLEAGQPGKWPGEGGENIDDWNEEHVLETRNLTLDESRDYLDANFNTLVETMRKSPKATRGAGIGATGFHYGLHKDDLMSLVDQPD